MYQKVKAYVEKYHMLTGKDSVIAGVSGGADSVCLLFVLLRMRKELGFALHAVHVHHGIRRESADADEAYVREICAREGVGITVFHENVPAYAKEHGLTEEEAGREVRRRDFCQVLTERNGTKIAVAHHMNDNAETVLFNLCRGTGFRGLGGIPPVSGVWIHPFLCVRRREIESYLEKRGISYCTDETNEENSYTRNKLRNEILPCLEREVNAQAAFHIAETAAQMQALKAYLELEVRQRLEECVERPGKGKILLLKEKYESQPEALRPYVIYGLICEAAGRKKDIEAVHVRLASGLLEGQTGRQLHFPYGVRVKRCYEGLYFLSEGVREEDLIPDEPDVTSRIIERDAAGKVFPQNIYTKWFDYDIIKNTVKIRHREPGDYITIDKAGHTQKLKKYFINEKIPEGKRDSIWLAADGKHIMWVVGYRQNQIYQVTEKTERILEIKFYGGEEDGGNSKNHD